MTHPSEPNHCQPKSQLTSRPAETQARPSDRERAPRQHATQFAIREWAGVGAGHDAGRE
jgi:hypothetical protein